MMHRIRCKGVQTQHMLFSHFARALPEQFRRQRH